MHYIRAVICLGLFGWLGYSVLTDSFPGGDNGSSKSRALNNMIDNATDAFGVMQTGMGLFAIGAALALFFVIKQHREPEFED